MVLEKSFAKKWFKWYEGSDYQQVIPIKNVRMVREWYELLFIGRGEGGSLAFGLRMFVLETYVYIGCILFQKCLILWVL